MHGLFFIKKFLASFATIRNLCSALGFHGWLLPSFKRASILTQLWSKVKHKNKLFILHLGLAI